MSESENGIEFVVSQRPVGGRDSAQHIGVQVDLIEGDGVVQAIVEIVSHRHTSIAVPDPASDACQATGSPYCHA